MTRRVVVLDPGPLTTVQDPGRPGYAHLGVPRSGWLDAPAALLANRLVGNPPSAALLETTVGGVGLRVEEALAVAVTGASAPVTVDGAPVAWGEPVSVPAGAEVRVGPATSGVRSYVAFAGGLEVPPLLGSRATDTLAGIGPAPLVSGDALAVGTRVAHPRPVDVPRVPFVAGVLRVGPGPRDDWVVDGLTALTRARWEVAADSNRVALRLSGPPVARRAGELPTEGLVLGGVQVPADGHPLVFLADHPTTGGYPVVGVVLPDDLWQCAQLRPGDEVRLVAASVPQDRQVSG